MFPKLLNLIAGRFLRVSTSFKSPDPKPRKSLLPDRLSLFNASVLEDGGFSAEDLEAGGLRFRVLGGLLRFVSQGMFKLDLGV